MYGPNLEERIDEIAHAHGIIGGDWNLVLDFASDYHNYKHYNNIKAEKAS